MPASFVISAAGHFAAVFSAGAMIAVAIGISPAYPQLSKAQITVLYDAFGKDAAMRKDWGFSALVEVAGKRILFDTGNDRDIFAANVKAKNVDLTKLDFVVLSHRHGDHIAGLAHVLSINPTLSFERNARCLSSAKTIPRKETPCPTAKIRKAFW